MTDDLFSYATEGNWKTPGPSAEAARQASAKAPRLRELALAEIEAAPGGLTAEEVAERLGRDKCSIRARVSELYKMGRIMDSGRRRTSTLGAAVTVWTMPPADMASAA